ncbi:hypothetical protein [Phreatobacter stygius]|uniref:Uncharacterized protein n=1 Tax=Phreatobacter stygius TaxID=1940610 RepID=A0A4D7AVV1_9HYPH|nr:hypothetical protein [Phreatobacter stygius]QCI63685.1 hypothetical protein E8M01_05190 [Phreatobacter stygius]
MLPALARVPADAPPLAVERDGEPQSVARSVQDRLDVSECDTLRHNLRGTAAVAGHRDAPLRVTPELIAFYKKRAHELRAETIRGVGSALWSLLTRTIQPR